MAGTVAVARVARFVGLPGFSGLSGFFVGFGLGSEGEGSGALVVGSAAVVSGSSSPPNISDQPRAAMSSITAAPTSHGHHAGRRAWDPRAARSRASSEVSDTWSANSGYRAEGSVGGTSGGGGGATGSATAGRSAVSVRENAGSAGSPTGCPQLTQNRPMPSS